MEGTTTRADVSRPSQDASGPGDAAQRAPGARLPGKRVMLARLDAALARQRRGLFVLRGRTESEMLRRIRKESDTGLVLMMAVLLEQELTDLLAAVFIKDSHTKAFLKRLNGKLEMKVSLVNALGLMPARMYEDAVLVTRIRNSLAHRPLSGTFRGRDIGTLVRQLSYGRVPARRSRRMVFIQSVDRVFRRLQMAQRLVVDLRSGRLRLAQVRVLMASAGGAEASHRQGRRQAQPGRLPRERGHSSSEVTAMRPGSSAHLGRRPRR